MKNTFKYVIFESIDGIEIPVIFSKLIKHSNVAAQMADANNGHGKRKVVSAGFVGIEEKATRKAGQSDVYKRIVFNCFGESESLKIKSRKAIDGEIIKQSYSQEISA